MEKLQRIILNNEVQWLKSIGCEIELNIATIDVKNKYNITTDFNFTVIESYSIFDNNFCYRVSNKVRDKETLKSGYIQENSYDINFIYVPQKHVANSFKIIEVEYREWKTSNEIARRIEDNIHYYYIYLGGEKVGKFSNVIDKNIIGIYDFELNDNLRNCGLGTKFLKEYCDSRDKVVFIQTWSENTGAIKCYQNVGFIQYECLYRYAMS